MTDLEKLLDDLKGAEIPDKSVFGSFNYLANHGNEWKIGHEGYAMNHYKYHELAERLNRLIGQLDRLERIKRLIDEACKKNGGLPW